MRVADAFWSRLESERFAGAFERVVFAIYDRSKLQRTRTAFQERFAV